MAESSPTTSTQDEVTVVSLGPDYENLDEHVLEELQQLLLKTADHIDPPLLVLNLSHTQFFGSSFIEVLFRVWNRIKKRNGQFAICCLTPYCAEVIEVTHLDRIWHIADTQDEAVAAVKASANAPSS